jgi:hypothetical protein
MHSTEMQQGLTVAAEPHLPPGPPAVVAAPFQQHAGEWRPGVWGVPLLPRLSQGHRHPCRLHQARGLQGGYRRSCLRGARDGTAAVQRYPVGSRHHGAVLEAAGSCTVHLCCLGWLRGWLAICRGTACRLQQLSPRNNAP